MYYYIHTYIHTTIGGFEKGAALARLSEAQDLNTVENRYAYIHTVLTSTHLSIHTVHTYIHILVT